MAKFEITVKAMCSRETFTFRADTEEDFINAIADEVKKPNSSFTEHDAAAIFTKDEVVKMLMDCADKTATLEIVKKFIANN